MNTFLQGLQQDIWRWLFRSLVTLTTCSSHLPVFGEQHERHHVCGHHTGAACEICIKENWMKVLREIEKKDLVSARSAHGITMQLQWTPNWNTHMQILEASISRVVLPFSCLSQYFANTITIFSSTILSLSLLWCTVWKESFFFNIVIWRSRQNRQNNFCQY